MLKFNLSLFTSYTSTTGPDPVNTLFPEPDLTSITYELHSKITPVYLDQSIQRFIDPLSVSYPINPNSKNQPSGGPFLPAKEPRYYGNPFIDANSPEYDDYSLAVGQPDEFAPTGGYLLLPGETIIGRSKGSVSNDVLSDSPKGTVSDTETYGYLHPSLKALKVGLIVQSDVKPSGFSGQILMSITNGNNKPVVIPPEFHIGDWYIQAHKQWHDHTLSKHVHTFPHKHTPT